MSRVPPEQRRDESIAVPADRTPLPVVDGSTVEPRVAAAWREWLGALARDAEAALAAAMAYEELDAAGRDRWLTALEQDAPRVGVPTVAVYAPLLAVESDPARRARIAQAIGPEGAPSAREPTAFSGQSASGSRVAALVWPLYLDFVQVLACAFSPDRGFDWVRHDPIVQRGASPRAGDELGGVVLEAAPLKALVDDLALSVLAHTRSGRSLPDALRVFADLFGLPAGAAP